MKPVKLPGWKRLVPKTKVERKMSCDVLVR
jgi:hypothetical protein